MLVDYTLSVNVGKVMKKCRKNYP